VSEKTDAEVGLMAGVFLTLIAAIILVFCYWSFGWSTHTLVWLLFARVLIGSLVGAIIGAKKGL